MADYGLGDDWNMYRLPERLTDMLGGRNGAGSVVEDAGEMGDVERLKLALANPGLIIGMGRPGIDWLRSTFMTAPVFRFDALTSAKVGHLSMNLDMINPIIPDIRLPTRSCVLKLKFRPLLTEIFKNYPDDVKSGMEIDRAAITSLVLLCHVPNPELPIIDIYLLWNVDNMKVGLCPFFYKFDAHGEHDNDHPSFKVVTDHIIKTTIRPDKVEMVRRAVIKYGLAKHVSDFAPTRLARMLYMFSSAFMSDKYAVPGFREGLASLLYKVSMRRTLAVDQRWREAAQVARAVAEETRGTPRIALCALALLSMREHEIVEVAEPKRKPGLIRHKNHTAPYFSESVVRLAVPDKRFVYLCKRVAAAAAERAKHRRHLVIGTWCHRGGERECEHAWQEIDVHHSQCAMCARKKWWRRDHARGDASLGWVQHDHYDVVTGEGKT